MVDLSYGNNAPPGTVKRDFSVAFARFQTAALVTSVYGFNSSAKWASVSQNWEQCAIKGMSLRYMPGNLKGQVDVNAGVNEEGQVNNMLVYEDINTYDTT